MTDLKIHMINHFKSFYYGDNWTEVNLKAVLEGVNWKMAIFKIEDFNTIASLTFHINYFTSRLIDVLQGRPLLGNDKESFLNRNAIFIQKDWDELVMKTFRNANLIIEELTKMDMNLLFQDFGGLNKYGSYFKNIFGMIEHAHYHLGQITIIKKHFNSVNISI